MAFAYIVTLFVITFLVPVGLFIFSSILWPMFVTLKGIPSLPLYFPTILLFKPKNIFSVYRDMQSLYFPQPTWQRNEWSVRKMFYMVKWVVVVNDPGLGRMVLADTHRFQKSSFKIFPYVSLAQLAVGTDNLLLLNGDHWKNQRRIINPVFKQKWHEEEFAKLLNLMLKYWQEQGTSLADGSLQIEVTGWMQRITLETLGKFIFDFDFNALADGKSEHAEKYNGVMDHVFTMKAAATPAWAILRTLLPWVDKFHKSVDEFNGILLELINAKIKNPGDDIFSSLVKSSLSADKSSRLDPAALRSNAVIFFLAGHDTTSTALSTILYYLAKYPDIQDRVYREIEEVMGSAGVEEDLLTAPSHEELLRMPYLNAVIKETLRFIPPVSNVVRRTSEEVELGGHKIPAHTSIFLNILEMQRNEQAWPDPDAFNPDRFLSKKRETDSSTGSISSIKSTTTTTTSTTTNELIRASEADFVVADSEASFFTNPAWLPFGYGPRSCVGQTLSLVEQRIFIGMLVRRFRIKFPPSVKNVPLEIGIHKGSGVLLKVDPFDLVFTPRLLK